MKLVKTSDKYNSALKRRELAFFIDHMSSGTPRLYDVKKIIAQEYNTNEEKIYILKLETLTGTNRTTGIAEIYDQTERGKALVAEHIKKRNLPSRRTKKETK
jgi:ribosomal protein S24E